MVDRKHDTRYFKGTLVKVQDCNHLRVDIEVFGVVFKNMKLRLYGVSMPQWRSKDPFIKESADKCMKELKRFLKAGKDYTFRITGHDILHCEVYPEELFGQSLNDYMLRNGYALHNYIKKLDKILA